MAKVKNISDGPRGAYRDGVLVMAEKGEVIDADDFAPEWFAKDGKAAAAAEADDGKLPRNVPKLRQIAKDEGIDLGEASTADDIIAVIEARRGPPPPADEE